MRKVIDYPIISVKLLMIVLLCLPACTKRTEVVVVNDTLLSASLSGVLKVNSRFSTFDTLLATSRFRDTLYGTGPFTVFATTDQGFNDEGVNIYNASFFEKFRSSIL